MDRIEDRPLEAVRRRNRLAMRPDARVLTLLQIGRQYQTIAAQPVHELNVVAHKGGYVTTQHADVTAHHEVVIHLNFVRLLNACQFESGWRVVREADERFSGDSLKAGERFERKKVG